MYNKISGGWLKHWDFMLLDMIFLQAAYILSYMVRNGINNPYENRIYLNIGIFICMIDLCASFFLEGYRGIMRRDGFMEFKAVIKHVFTVCIFVLAYLFLSKSSEEFSRISFVVFSVSAVAVLFIERSLWKLYLLKYKKIYYMKKALLVLTSSDIAEEVVQTAERNTYNELQILGIVLADRDDLVGSVIGGEKVVCRKEELYDYIQTKWVDGILINVSEQYNIPGQFVTQCTQMGVTVHIKISEIGEDAGNQELEKIAGYVVVSTGIGSSSPGALFAKRLIDIAGALIGLVCTGILSIFVIPAIKIASPGPVIFRQTRIGRNGRKFQMYKFRSMHMDAEERKKALMDQNQMQGNIFKLYNDPRIIGSGPDGKRHGLGWFLRKTSIDEFPQFWNVLKGDMSLVGTRPPTVDEWEKYEHHHRARLAMKPGITGIWQISGRSDITDFEEIVKLDMEYIKNWNIGLDLRIIWKTLGVVMKGKGSC